MSTVFVLSFLVGLGLSVVSFVGGAHRSGGQQHHGPRLKMRMKVKGRASALNLAAVTAFLVWFGGGGLLLERLAPWMASWIGGGAVAIGLAGGSLINHLITALARREHAAEPLTMIGTIARTTLPIRERGGTGEIVFTHQGTRQVAGARSDSGRAIGKGSEVIVTRYEKGIAYVATWDELTPRGNEEESSC